jgi:REP element-mobilizing transposase RayT
MRYNRDVHRRRSIRLRGFDYSQPGAYFITVCTHERAPLFGDVVNGAMVLNAAGVMVDAVWRDMPDHYSGVVLGEHIVMPNHFHGVVEIVGAGPRACPDFMECACPHDMPTTETGQPQGVAPTALSLPDLVHRFKSWTTRQYADGVNHYGWPAFNRRLWQRNYHEHIIRNEQAYAAITDYIHHNPQRWQDDVYCCAKRGQS